MFRILLKREGFMILLSVFVIVVFLILGILGLSLMATQTHSYINRIKHLQAFYLAEAARQYFLEYLLPYERKFTGLMDLERNFGGGTFLVDFYPSGYPNPQDKIAYVRFVGIIDDVRHSIVEKFDISNLAYGWGSFVLNHSRNSYPLVIEGESEDNKVSITGNIYQNGELSLHYTQITGDVFVLGNLELGDVDITGDVYVSGDVSLASDGSSCIYGTLYYKGTLTGDTGCVEDTENDFLLPFMPPFRMDSTYYDNELDIAQMVGEDCSSLGESGGNFSLGGRNWYCEDDVVINTTFSGAPRVNIVATGGIQDNTYYGPGYISLFAEGNITSTTTDIEIMSYLTMFSGSGDISFTSNYNPIREVVGVLLAPEGELRIQAGSANNFFGIIHTKDFYLDDDTLSFRGAMNVADRVYNIQTQDSSSSIGLVYDLGYIPLRIKGFFRPQESEWKEY